MEEIQIPKQLLEQKIYNEVKTPTGMELKVYLHRTKKKEFQVADCFSVFVDLNRLPDDKKTDVDFINRGFSNDCREIAKTRECIRKNGTGYISFMRPQYEGEEKDNGNDKVYFDNKEMLFMLRPPKKKTTRKKKTEVKTNEEEKE